MQETVSELNPSKVGLITELKCITYLLEQNFNVLLPQGNYTKYDLVIEKEGRFYRIQCKHASPDEHSFKVRTWYALRGSQVKQTYTNKDCDYFMTEYNNQFYIFPIFGTTETKFWLEKKSYPNSKFAEDFLADKILATL